MGFLSKFISCFGGQDAPSPEPVPRGARYAALQSPTTHNSTASVSPIKSEAGGASELDENYREQRSKPENGRLEARSSAAGHKVSTVLEKRLLDAEAHGASVVAYKKSLESCESSNAPTSPPGSPEWTHVKELEGQLADVRQRLADEEDEALRLRLAMDAIKVAASPSAASSPRLQTTPPPPRGGPPHALSSPAPSPGRGPHPSQGRVRPAGPSAYTRDMGDSDMDHHHQHHHQQQQQHRGPARVLQGGAPTPPAHDVHPFHMLQQGVLGQRGAMEASGRWAGGQGQQEDGGAQLRNGGKQRNDVSLDVWLGAAKGRSGSPRRTTSMREPSSLRQAAAALGQDDPRRSLQVSPAAPSLNMGTHASASSGSSSRSSSSSSRNRGSAAPAGSSSVEAAMETSEDRSPARSRGEPASSYQGARPTSPHGTAQYRREGHEGSLPSTSAHTPGSVNTRNWVPHSPGSSERTDSWKSVSLSASSEGSQRDRREMSAGWYAGAVEMQEAQRNVRTDDSKDRGIALPPRQQHHGASLWDWEAAPTNSGSQPSEGKRQVRQSPGNEGAHVDSRSQRNGAAPKSPARFDIGAAGTRSAPVTPPAARRPEGDGGSSLSEPRRDGLHWSPARGAIAPGSAGAQQRPRGNLRYASDGLDLQDSFDSEPRTSTTTPTTAYLTDDLARPARPPPSLRASTEDYNFSSTDRSAAAPLSSSSDSLSLSASLSLSPLTKSGAGVGVGVGSGGHGGVRRLPSLRSSRDMPVEHAGAGGSLSGSLWVAEEGKENQQGPSPRVGSSPRSSMDGGKPLQPNLLRPGSQAQFDKSPIRVDSSNNPNNRGKHHSGQGAVVLTPRRGGHGVESPSGSRMLSSSPLSVDSAKRHMRRLSSPDDIPIIASGSAVTLESDEDTPSRGVTVDGRGVPNSTTKYQEDRPVTWSDTPFEERLEYVLATEDGSTSRRQLFSTDSPRQLPRSPIMSTIQV